MIEEPRITARLETPHGVMEASNRAGSDVLLGDVAGWHGGVAVTGQFTDRIRHGQFPVKGRGGARILSLSLSRWADTDAEMEAFRRGVSAVLGDGESGTLAVDWDGMVLSATVQRDGEVAVSHDAGFATALIPLRAPDPFLYGPQQTVFLHPIGTGVGLEYPLYADGVLSYGAAITSQDPISNPGNAPAWPHFLIVGDFPSGFRVSAGGRVVEWPVPTVPQAPVLVDMSGSIWVGSSNQTHRAGRTEWFDIPPGSTIDPVFEPIQFGSGWAEARIWPTFL